MAFLPKRNEAMLICKEHGKKCPVCGGEIINTFSFCPHCGCALKFVEAGSVLVSALICKQCYDEECKNMPEKGKKK